MHERECGDLRSHSKIQHVYSRSESSTINLDDEVELLTALRLQVYSRMIKAYTTRINLSICSTFRHLIDEPDCGDGPVVPIVGTERIAEVSRDDLKELGALDLNAAIKQNVEVLRLAPCHVVSINDKSCSSKQKCRDGEKN